MEEEDEQQQQQQEAAAAPDAAVIQAMQHACAQGDLAGVQQIVRSTHQEGPIHYARQQDDATGVAPLMVAAAHGHGAVVRYLLEECGAPWNAVDRQGRCAGDYATQQQHWDVVNQLVEWGTRAELILGMVERGRRDSSSNCETVVVV